MGNVVGLCGYPGAGKSEVRKILVKNHDFEDINSKSVIYGMAAMATGLTEKHFYDPALKNNTFNGVTHRRIAGTLGLQIESMFGGDYLIGKALENHKVAARTKNFVVDSLRMSQPLLLRDRMIIAEIVNPLILTPGENTFDDYYKVDDRFIIENKGSLEDLEREVELFIFRTVSSKRL